MAISRFNTFNFGGLAPTIKQGLFGLSCAGLTKSTSLCLSPKRLFRLSSPLPYLLPPQAPPCDSQSRGSVLCLSCRLFAVTASAHLKAASRQTPCYVSLSSKEKTDWLRLRWKLFGISKNSKHCSCPYKVKKPPQSFGMRSKFN